MKQILYILVIFFTLPFTGYTQNDNTISEKEETTFKNQIDLDVYLLGVEGSYKRRIKPKIFAGLGLGVMMIKYSAYFPITDNTIFFETIRLRPFLGFQLSNNFHVEIGGVGNISIDNNGAGAILIGVEAGVFVKIWKLELGIRPSLLYSLDTDNLDEAVLGTSLLIIKIPLNRW